MTNPIQNDQATSTGIRPMRVDPLAMRAQYRAWLLRDGADEETLDHLIQLERALATAALREQLKDLLAGAATRLVEAEASVVALRAEASSAEKTLDDVDTALGLLRDKLGVAS